MRFKFVKNIDFGFVKNVFVENIGSVFANLLINSTNLVFTFSGVLQFIP